MQKFRPEYLRSKPLVTALLVVVALTFGIIASTTVVVQRYVSTNNSLQNAYAYNAALEQTLSLLKDAETGQRGFLLTQNEDYLMPYTRARAQLPQVLTMAKSQLEPKAYRHLSSMANERVAILAEAIGKQRQDDMAGAVAVVSSGRGKVLMDNVRLLTAELQQRKTQQIQREARDAKGLSSWVLLAILGGALLNAALIVFVLRLAKNLEKKEQVAEAAQVRDKALFNSIGDGLLVIDEDGIITKANPEAGKALGYPAETLEGAWFPGVVLALDEHGSPVDPIDRPVTQSLMSGRTISTQLRYQRKDGSTFPAAVTVSPVIIDNKPVGAIEVFHDLTGEHELEQAKEDFVSLASHQLRTPATGAKAFISMLIDGYGGALNNRQQEFLQKILRANERQLEIVNDMLNVARIDSGRIVPKFTKTDFVKLLRTIIEEQRPILDERKQHLHMVLPAKTRQLMCDPVLIHMAIENIVDNAGKYTREGGTITITLHFTKKQAHITIKDTGVGIAEADLPKLFQRFSRIHNSLSISRGGTGLGLYLANKIILKHNGHISVQSTPGSGTTFTIDVPFMPVPVSAEVMTSVGEHR